MREGFPQYLGIGLGDHGSHIVVGVFAELDLFGVVKLRPVRLV